MFVDVERERVGTGSARVIFDACDEAAADAASLLRLQHVDLVELGLGRALGDIPRREAGNLAAVHREQEPAVRSVEKACKYVERVTAFQHVVDLLVRDDPGIMGAPDDTSEPLHLG